MAQYILSAEAQGDLHSIWDFIALDNRDAADRIVDELLAAFKHLAEWPGSGHTRPDLTTKDVRFWPVRSYMVIYSETVPVEIVTILHGARDIPSFLGE